MSSVLCPDCISGTVSEGTPAGTINTIHGLPTYVAAPPEGVQPKGLVVIITDAFGYKTVNSQVLADQYAKKGGFLVYLPDFLGGKLPQHVPTSQSTW
jgi:dienelactone hydrolase